MYVLYALFLKCSCNIISKLCAPFLQILDAPLLYAGSVLKVHVSLVLSIWQKCVAVVRVTGRFSGNSVSTNLKYAITIHSLSINTTIIITIITRMCHSIGPAKASSRRFCNGPVTFERYTLVSRLHLCVVRGPPGTKMMYT